MSSSLRIRGGLNTASSDFVYVHVMESDNLKNASIMISVEAVSHIGVLADNLASLFMSLRTLVL
jgi:hypothetical protein